MKKSYLKRQPLFTKPSYKKPSKKKKIRFILKKAFKRMLMVLGALVLISAVINVTLAIKFTNQKQEPLPEQFALYLPLDNNILDYQAQAGPYGFLGEAPTITQIIGAIEKAKTDDRVKGLIFNLRGGSISLVNIMELQPVIEDFKATGKFTKIYATSYGGMGGGGLATYYLASMFDEIWMQPIGTVIMTGIRAEIPYFKDALSKIGVEPQFLARKEYKNVFESAQRNDMSAETKESTEVLIGDLMNVMTVGIAAHRGVAVDKVKEWINHGLFVDQEALDKGLITHLDDISAFSKSVKLTTTGDAEAKNAIVTMATYGSRVLGQRNMLAEALHGASGEGQGKKPAAALIYGSGTIVSKSDIGGEDSPVSTDGMLIAEDIAGYIADAVRKDAIKIIVLRIDSPGGSPAASETVRQAIVEAKAKDKKVVVSMGSVAASGGYWIASAADHIFASPVTITGSIGVAGGKVSLAGLWQNIGVNWGYVSYGENAGMWSFNTPFSESEYAAVSRMMDNTYDSFIQRVAEGRNMTPEQADKVARGRVWSGLQAKEAGLVDTLGGLNDTLDYAATEIGAEGREGLNIVVLPKPQNPIELALKILRQQATIGQALEPIVTSLKPLSDAAMQAEMMGRTPVSTYAPLTIQ